MSRGSRKPSAVWAATLAAPAAVWIGYEFLHIAALIAFAGAGPISAMRSEEADGHLDNLLARPVSRATWLGRLGFGVLLVAAAGLGTHSTGATSPPHRSAP